MKEIPTFLGVLIVVALLASSPVIAEEWPSHPVKIVVPYGPGGISDILARLTADRLSKRFGQSFYIENRAGAGGAIGTDYAARAPGDGYTLYFGGGAEFSVIPIIQKISYDPVKMLTPISMVALNGMALVVSPSLPVHSLKEFVDYAKQHPGKINYGIGGVGTNSHLTPAAFARREDINLMMVPYQSTPPSVLALLSGEVQVFFGNISDIRSTILDGNGRFLAITSENRLKEFPDIPTVAESLPGFVMTGWNGYFAPTGTPQSVIARVSEAIAEICREPDVVKAMADLSIESIGGTPEQLRAAIQAEIPVYRDAVMDAGLLVK